MRDFEELTNILRARKISFQILKYKATKLCFIYTLTYDLRRNVFIDIYNILISEEYFVAKQHLILIYIIYYYHKRGLSSQLSIGFNLYIV